MKSIDIHQINVFGLGAIKFSAALVRDILESDLIQINRFYSNKYNYQSRFSESAVESSIYYYRFGVLSRIFEVCFWRYYRKQDNDIFILGDLPLNTRAKQYVLCQQSLMFKKFSVFSINFFKFGLFKIIFKLFLKSNDVVLVQNSEMKRYIKEYFGDNITIKIIDPKSASFGWPEFYRKGRCPSPHQEESIRLIYPAAFVPHKNHHLLSTLTNKLQAEVLVTIDNNMIQQHSSVSCIGPVSRAKVYEYYETVDGLLFLSSNESLGMPILEAIKCNLPIVCPYAEYTRELTTHNCLFFDLDRPKSLEEALFELKNKLRSGWWPSWQFSKQFGSLKYQLISYILLDSPD